MLSFPFFLVVFDLALAWSMGVAGSACMYGNDRKYLQSPKQSQQYREEIRSIDY